MPKKLHYIFDSRAPQSPAKPLQDLIVLKRNAAHCRRWVKAEQIDGIPDLEPARDVGWDPLEKAERLLGASRAKIQHSQGGGAFYRPSTDTIHLPSREQ